MYGEGGDWHIISTKIWIFLPLPNQMKDVCLKGGDQSSVPVDFGEYGVLQHTADDLTFYSFAFSSAVKTFCSDIAYVLCLHHYQETIGYLQNCHQHLMSCMSSERPFAIHWQCLVDPLGLLSLTAIVGSYSGLSLLTNMTSL